jgi:hypothetical protein
MRYKWQVRIHFMDKHSGLVVGSDTISMMKALHPKLPKQMPQAYFLTFGQAVPSARKTDIQVLRKLHLNLLK